MDTRLLVLLCGHRETSNGGGACKEEGDGEEAAGTRAAAGPRTAMAVSTAGIAAMVVAKSQQRKEKERGRRERNGEQKENATWLVFPDLGAVTHDTYLLGPNVGLRCPGV